MRYHKYRYWSGEQPVFVTLLELGASGRQWQEIKKGVAGMPSPLSSCKSRADTSLVQWWISRPALNPDLHPAPNAQPMAGKFLDQKT
ncbi:hypothetical protein [Candidatus Electrothrix sp.]|uniref:hypothetical protein n=1 Tax=Candidatus Electrothrix sp. TaxID=2170559 RepID=UPI004055D7D1